MTTLLGKVAIITGASRGIGAASAIALAKEGAHVVLVDLLNCEETSATIRKLQEFSHSEVMSVGLDVKDNAVIEQLMKDVYERFGSIDIVVNNAGTCSRLDLEQMTEEMWDRDINTNLRGTFLMSKAAIYPYMKKQGHGKIINVSSISGIMGGPLSYNDGKKSAGLVLPTQLQKAVLLR